MSIVSLPEQIINGLRLTGMISGSYLGFKYGNNIKDYCISNYPSCKNIHDKFIKNNLKKGKINEYKMFSILGSMYGIIGGYYMWPITISGMIFIMIETN